jgi:hypothetical protein
MAWQYKVVYVDVRGRVSSEGEEQIIDKNERQSAFIRGVLNQYGADGWEMVGIQHLGMRQTAYYIFKKEGEGKGREVPPATETTGGDDDTPPVEPVRGTA